MAKKATPTTKKAMAIALCKRMERRKNIPAPKVIKEAMMTEIGMTKAQAATYYHKARKGGEWRA